MNSHRTVVDLSHPMTPNMPAFPGKGAPVFLQDADLNKGGYREKQITLLTHTGTHLDAPAHIMPQGATLDRLPVETFVGKGCVLDMRGKKEITPEDLEPHARALASSEFVLLRTGWNKYWGEPKYTEDIPVLTSEAAQELLRLGNGALKGVGLDTISVDPIASTELPVHKILLGQGLVIVENLTNLGRLPAQGFLFLALPLPLADGDGSPVRAVGLMQE